MFNEIDMSRDVENYCYMKYRCHHLKLKEIIRYGNIIEDWVCEYEGMEANLAVSICKNGCADLLDRVNTSKAVLQCQLGG